MDFKNLRELLRFVRDKHGMDRILLRSEVRSKLLGEFLEMSQEAQAVMGRYCMERGEWRLYRTPRQTTLIEGYERK